ncbi:peptidoglycan-associated lipoprotein [Sinobacterium caligoides]|uniref:Peptidoglycan-associated lipoprotein n=1 Tax=Sinobacterium caligoides TaxID=933926 RepID=A0A3N2DG95_9GAMM|nr:OmpA family protein [Sinobacterium caligoides]ROR98751.1 peptidoglycan-associated lipoprotein [Sinobacterium caligoides]
MALHKLKTAAGLAVAMALVSGCSSTQTADDAAAAEQAAAEAAAQAAADAAAAAAAAQAEAEAALQSVYLFEFDTSTLSAEMRAGLDAQAAFLRDKSGVVRLEGHADERGSPEYNLALGERRAQAVANYLAIQGVPRAQLEVISYGEEKPAVEGYGDAVWSQNRRVELKYVD